MQLPVSDKPRCIGLPSPAFSDGLLTFGNPYHQPPNLTSSPPSRIDSGLVDISTQGNTGTPIHRTTTSISSASTGGPNACVDRFWPRQRAIVGYVEHLGTGSRNCCTAIYPNSYISFCANEKVDKRKQYKRFKKTFVHPSIFTRTFSILLELSIHVKLWPWLLSMASLWLCRYLI